MSLRMQIYPACVSDYPRRVYAKATRTFEGQRDPENGGISVKAGQQVWVSNFPFSPVVFHSRCD